MNYLFHLFLSGSDAEILVGNFAGDFVKGRPGAEYPLGMRNGFKLHRHIDSFAEHNDFFIRSRRRLSPEFGLYRGILVDLYYDHFLSVHWDEYSDGPLPLFLSQVRSMVEARASYLPTRLQGLIPLIFEDFIPSYRSTEGIDQVLKRMSRRVRRDNPLSGGGAELIRHYQELNRDFREFLPEMRTETASFLTTLKASD